MSADSTKLQARPAAAMAGQSALWVAAAGITALWTAVVALGHVDGAGLALSGSTRSAVVYGFPAALAAGLVFDARAAALRPLRLAAAWSAIVVAAELVSGRVSAGDTALIAAPLVAIAAVAVARRPALAVSLVLVMSGFYGSLIAFWRFPEEKTVQLVFAGLTLALIWRALVGGRTYPLRLTLGLALPALYIYVTLVQTILDADSAAALRGFMTSTWFMLALPLIALSGWSRDVHERIAKAIVVVSGLVGAYAVYRWLAGISVTEFKEWGGDRYNYVGGELRLLGSFPTGQDLGGWTALVVPFCLACALTFRGPWRMVSLVAAALCLIALAGSELRIAVVAVALGALAVVVLHELSHGFRGRRLGTTLTAALAMLALVLSAFWLTGGTSDEVTHSYSSLLRPFDRSDPSVNARLYKWDVALRDLRSHPFGYGVGTANKQSTRLLSSVESIGQYDVDNGFLRVALEQGLAVMALFVLAFVLLTADLARKALRARERLPAGIAIGAVGTMVSCFVLFWAVAFQDGPRALPIWIIAGLGLAQFAVPRTPEKT